MLGPRRIGAVLSAFLAASAGCGHAPPPRQPPPPQVSVATVLPQTIAEPVELSGEVEPLRRVEVRSRVEGIVVERPFVEGSFVEKGQVLYRLDEVRYRAAYQSAQAQYDNAKRTLARDEPLLAQHAIAQQDVDNARAQLESAQGAVDQAKKDLDDLVIRAEIAGRVGTAHLELGARVTGPADLLTTIDELNQVYVVFRPSTQQLLTWDEDPRSRALIQPGSPLAIRVVLPNGMLLPRVGHLNFVAPALDTATGTQEFRALFENPDHALVPGQFVRVRLEGFARQNALAVPQVAVQQGLGRQFVYVVGAGDTATARDVTPGPWSGNLWIIDDGLKPGDRVVVDGTQKVMPGRPVQPTPVRADSAGVALQGPGGRARSGGR